MQDIRVLSYNIHYKSMQTDPKHPYCTLSNSGVTSCLETVADFIDKHGPYDFVCLQEATNWNLILERSPILQKMNYYSHKPGLDQIVVFADSKYKLLDRLDGWMADPNRPFTVLFFKENLCFVSLHAGHKYDIYKLDSYVERALDSDLKNKAERLQMLRDFDIIIAGDFNSELKSGLKILGRKLYGFNNTASCCSSKLQPDGMRSAFDHVLSTFPNNQSNVYPVHSASDHLPIIANLKRSISNQNLSDNAKSKIGYDFDGVLHREVGETDWEGQRHPSRLHGPYKPLNLIIDQIRSDLKSGYNIYIITARNRTWTSENAIRNHLRTHLGSKADSIPIHWTAGLDKTNVIQDLGLDTFYDDSILRIDQLIRSKRDGKLPLLQRAYLVDPKNEKIELYDLKKLDKWYRTGSSIY